jgi:uncharacterized protein (DUF983 family)
LTCLCRTVSEGLFFAEYLTAVPECKNCISAGPRLMQKYSFCTPPETFRSAVCC